MSRRLTPTIALAVAWYAVMTTAAIGASHLLHTLSFDEIAFQSVDDLVINGVTFDYKLAGVDSAEAFYNSFGPGMLTYVSDPSLTSDSAGVLTLDFAVPTATLEFGLALNTATALAPGFQVELFDVNLISLGVTPVDVTPSTGAVGFSENLFEFEGTPISRAIIDLLHEPGSFALDNLKHEIIPEPSTACLAAVALFTCFWTGRRRAT